MAKTPFVVRVEFELHAAIRQNSKDQGRPLADVMSEAIQEYLEKRGAQTHNVPPLRLIAGRPRQIAWPEDLIVVLDVSAESA